MAGAAELYERVCSGGVGQVIETKPFSGSLLNFKQRSHQIWIVVSFTLTLIILLRIDVHNKKESLSNVEKENYGTQSHCNDKELIKLLSQQINIHCT